MENDETNSSSMTKEILDKMAALITAAFGLVAALAWNDAIKAIFNEIFGPSNTIVPMLAYALIVTVLAVIMTILVTRAAFAAKSIGRQKTFTCKLCDYESIVESKVLEHMFKEHAASQDKFLMK